MKGNFIKGKMNLFIIVIIILIVVAVTCIVLYLSNQKEDGNLLDNSQGMMNTNEMTVYDEGEGIKASKVATGSTHVIIEDNNGEIWVCGNNSVGQLGIGNRETQQSLVKLEKTDTGKEIVFPKRIIAGEDRTIIEDSDGEVWSCGDRGGKRDTLTKLIIGGKEIINPNRILIEYGFIVVEDSDGMLWSSRIFGDGSYGSSLGRIENTVTGKEIIKPNKIEVGSNFIFIEDSDGIVWASGNNEYGELFIEDRNPSGLVEIKAAGRYPNKIAAGSQHVIIEKSDGTLIGAGRGLYGSLPTIKSSEPKTDSEIMEEMEQRMMDEYSSKIWNEFKTPDGREIINPNNIICKNYTTIIEDKDGEIWVCGWNYGQYGNTIENYYDKAGYNEDNKVALYELTLLKDLSKRKFNKINNIYAGGDYLIIQDENGILWCAGRNEAGQLGLGTMEEERNIGSFVLFGVDRKHLYMNNNTSDKMSYEIVYGIPGVETKIAQRGYKVVEKNGYYYIIIAMGEKNTGGYSIEATKIDIDGDDIHIYVKETTAKGVVTQAYTQPCEIVKLNKKPKNIIIENKDLKYKFQELK